MVFLASTWLGAKFGGSTIYIAMIGGLLAIIILFLPDGLVSLFPGARALKLARKALLRPPAAPPGGRP